MLLGLLDSMAQIGFPGWQRRWKIFLRIIPANSERTQGGPILQAILALKENHSITRSFIQDNWLDTELLHFRAKFMELGQDNFFRIQCLHVTFRSLVKVNADKHKNLICRYENSHSSCQL